MGTFRFPHEHIASVLLHLYNLRLDEWKSTPSPKACKSLNPQQKAEMPVLVIDLFEQAEFLLRGKGAGKAPIKSIERTHLIIIPGYDVRHILAGRTNSIEAGARSKKASPDQFLDA